MTVKVETLDNVLRSTLLTLQPAMAFQNIVNSCAKVVSGDAAEELQLGLEPIKVNIPKINISPTEIKIEQNVLSQVAAAAEVLGLSIVHETATSGLALLTQSAMHHTKHL